MKLRPWAVALIAVAAVGIVAVRFAVNRKENTLQIYGGDDVQFSELYATRHEENLTNELQIIPRITEEESQRIIEAFGIAIC